MIRQHLLTLAATTLLAASAVALAPVEVVGLFKDRAVIRAPGGDVMLKTGETRGDLTLLSATATEARVRYRGQEYRLSLSERVSGSFRAAEKPRIAINSDEYGQYRVRGSINGRYVNFLVDTGASVVALSSREADILNLEYQRGQRSVVQTAQGTVDSHMVILDEVNVGGITAYNVQAAVIDGEYPVEILLGMSFLRQVGMQEQAGVLTLTQRH